MDLKGEKRDTLLPGNVSRFYLEKRGTRIEKQMT
jgi:hypothetical protein